MRRVEAPVCHNASHQVSSLGPLDAALTQMAAVMHQNHKPQPRTAKELTSPHLARAQEERIIMYTETTLCGSCFPGTQDLNSAAESKNAPCPGKPQFQDNKIVRDVWMHSQWLTCEPLQVRDTDGSRDELPELVKQAAHSFGCSCSDSWHRISQGSADQCKLAVQQLIHLFNWTMWILPCKRVTEVVGTNPVHLVNWHMAVLLDTCDTAGSISRTVRGREP